MIQKLRYNNGNLEALIASHELMSDGYINLILSDTWQPVPEDYFTDAVEANKEVV